MYLLENANCFEYEFDIFIIFGGSGWKLKIFNTLSLLKSWNIFGTPEFSAVRVLAILLSSFEYSCLYAPGFQKIRQNFGNCFSWFVGYLILLHQINETVNCTKSKFLIHLPVAASLMGHPMVNSISIQTATSDSDISILPLWEKPIVNNKVPTLLVRI